MNIDHPLEREPMVFFSDSVQDYTADVLYLILPRIMNPYSMHVLIVMSWKSIHTISSREERFLPGC